MDDYKSMYFAMFNKITDIIEELKKLQQDMEEKYISMPEIQPEKGEQLHLPEL